MIHAKQGQMDMEQRESPGEKSKDPLEELTEEQFLKDLYLHMKKRDTPIERIPHLGFKQIDLFLMFNTVKDLGGYHQVTAQQLWKQVYNTLGGNPRSTSAATCTRRHYEKLLLPYECHVKGIAMSVLPQHQAKHHLGWCDGDDGPGPNKRKLIQVCLPQGLYHPKPDLHGKLFPMTGPYPYYYPPGHSILPPYVPVTRPVIAHSPPAPKLHSPNPNLTSSDSGNESLVKLRVLADRYKSSKGLEVPLNLSLKAPSQESNHNPASSFSPPSPRFFNKPPTPYAPQPPQADRNARETRDGDAGAEVSPRSHPEEVKDAYVVDVKPASSSPTYGRVPTPRTEGDAAAQKPSSPKADFQSAWPKGEREDGTDVKRVDLSHILPSLPRDNGGKMEIEIPLSVLHKWLRMHQAESSAAVRGPALAAVPPNKDEQAGQRRFSQTSPTTVPSPASPHDQSPAAEDLRLRRRKVPTPPQTTHGHNSNSNYFPGCRFLPSGGTHKNAFSRGVYSAEQPDIMKSYSKPQSYWGAFDTATLKTSPGPVPFRQDYKAYRDNTGMSGRERSDGGPSTVLMVDSISGSVLQLTNEEIMKLKKMISSSA